ncbi:conserved hypothetical protein [Psychrobacter arcticus 273-4]|uniref:DUF1853 domain-containing protein n=1 Tax=Psychrobacter arcticus (strain DSM 17307 / VKM B-2377 / 273-4) TaxID=259536 RepID=Q4FUK7_PSYA2|nr:DUF1853 family protein [Psychrobacter arcticus]AAZ18301.1 conserved hypothetical protein [Psychrobacter arcticus 273-4]
MSELNAPRPDSLETYATYAPWEAYQRPYVRDLAYVLACPNVLTQWLDVTPHQNTHAISVHSAHFWQQQFEGYQQRLKELDTTNAYQALTRYLLKRPSPNRLGFHFEGLLSFWLKDGFARRLHPYETLANNVQLFNGKQTTGELDLILYNHAENLVEHWELAIKFFMGSAPFAPENWVGINSNDNLQRKMTHMQTKQFCTVWIDTENHGQVSIDKRYGVIKGRFFLPINTKGFDYPTWLTPSFPMHKWCDKYDKLNLAKINIDTLRAAHYIEWFSKRDFYDDRQSPIINSENGILKTGLYFAGDRPIVIYPKLRDGAGDKF